MDGIGSSEETGHLEGLCINELKSIRTKSTIKITFFENTKQLIDGMMEAKRFGNPGAYKKIYNVSKTINGTESLRFEEITYAYPNPLESYQFEKGQWH